MTDKDTERRSFDWAWSTVEKNVERKRRIMKKLYSKLRRQKAKTEIRKELKDST